MTEIFTVQDEQLKPGPNWNDFVNADRTPARLGKLGTFIAGVAFDPAKESGLATLDAQMDLFADAVQPPLSPVELEAFTGGTRNDGAQLLYNNAAVAYIRGVVK